MESLVDFRSMITSGTRTGQLGRYRRRCRFRTQKSREHTDVVLDTVSIFATLAATGEKCKTTADAASRACLRHAEGELPSVREPHRCQQMRILNTARMGCLVLAQLHQKRQCAVRCTSLVSRQSHDSCALQVYGRLRISVGIPRCFKFWSRTPARSSFRASG